MAEATSQRIALVSTGSILHSFSRHDPGVERPWAEGEEIEREIAQLAAARRVEELTRFDRRKWNLLEPEGNLAPLFVLLGALGMGFRGHVVGTSQLHGAFGMSVIEFARG